MVGRSCSSIRWARPSSCSGRAWTCGRTRISGCPPSPICFDGEIMHPRQPRHRIADPPGRAELDDGGARHHPSERTGSALRQTGSRLFGLQSWVALSARDEETAPAAFEHYDAGALPIVSGEGKTVRSDRRRRLRRALARADLEPDGLCRRDAPGRIRPAPRRGIRRAGDLHYTVSGAIEIAADGFGPGQLLGLPPRRPDQRAATEDSRFMVLGGESDGRPRHLW